MKRAQSQSDAPRSTVAAAIARVAPPVLAGVLFLALYALARADLPEERRFLMPSFDALWHEAFAQGAVWAELGAALGVTLAIAGAGLALAVGVGAGLGLLMFRFRGVERALFPYLVVLQSLPILAVAPLLQVALGYGYAAKIAITFLIAFFPVPTTLLFGLKSVERPLLELFRLERASWLTTLTKLTLPAALPALFAGLRIAAGLAVIGAIVGELFFQTGTGGLGQMIMNAKMNFEYPKMYAALMASALLSIAIFVGFSRLGARLFGSWHASGARTTP